jgi:hypothetical protein
MGIMSNPSEVEVICLTSRDQGRSGRVSLCVIAMTGGLTGSVLKLTSSDIVHVAV